VSAWCWSIHGGRLWLLYVFNQVVSCAGAISSFTQAHLQTTVERERRDFIIQPKMTMHCEVLTSVLIGSTDAMGRVTRNMNWRCVHCRTHVEPFPWHSHMDPEHWDQTDTVNCSRLLDTNLTSRLGKIRSPLPKHAPTLPVCKSP
jgi:hypothetical protein